MGIDKEEARISAILALLAAASRHGVVLSRTKVAKLLYLSDLRAVERNLTPFSGFSWRWLHYGPYDRSIVDVEGALEPYGVARDETVNYFGTPEYRLRMVTTAIPEEVELPPPYREIIDGVVEEFGHYSPTSLRDLTYTTKPMQEAMAEKANGDLLDLETVRPLPGIAKTLARFREVASQLGDEDEGDEEQAQAEIEEELRALALHRKRATGEMLG